MSIVTAIKDYIDLLNNVYDSLLDNFTLQHFLQQSFVYISGSIKYLIFYLFSFQWLRDFCYLPLLVPQLSASILKETFFLETPKGDFFTFLETPGYLNNKFLIGLLNSFFICLPISGAHLIFARRLLIQGIPAGIAAGLGTIIGQVWFLFCIIFGLRLFVIPWFFIEPLSYFFGVFLTLTIVSDMSHERSLRVIDLSKRETLIKIFFLNLLLSWTEQTCIFQYIGNITVSPEPTFLEIFSSNSELDFFITHGNYLFGFTIGSIFFTSFFGFFILKGSAFLLKISNLLYSTWIKKLNVLLLYSIVAFTVASFPFYGVEYLLLGPLGFVSQDKTFEKTMFLPTTLKDTNKLLGDNSLYQSLDTDISAFDRGQYLKLDANDSFEELNYQGEYAWTARQDRRPFFRSNVFKNIIRKFFNKTNQEEKNKQIPNVVEENSSRMNDSTISDGYRVVSSNKNKQDDSTISDGYRVLVQKENSEMSDNSDLSDFSEIDENTTNEKASFYFLQLTERLNINLDAEEILEPLLDKSFSDKFVDDRPPTNVIIDPVLEKKIKQKYYSNPVYKLLLSIDIDYFLARQPRDYYLTSLDEKNLYEKRLILANYYDSLRYYTQLPYLEEFKEFFNGSKSYADRVYNQQFKGTLKIVRRLFALTLNEDENPKEKRVLKFDQPLYKKQKNGSHKTKIGEETFEDQDSTKILPSNKFIQEEQNPLLHEELEYVKTKKSPFITLTNPIPFYSGWDEQLRKFVITNRLLPRNVAGYSMKIPYSQGDDYSILLSSKSTLLSEKSTIKNKNQNKQKLKYSSTKKVESQKSLEQDTFINREIINFTAWPIQKNVFTKFNKDVKIPYAVLFESLQNPENSKVATEFEEFQNLTWDFEFEFETFPPNLKKIDEDYIVDLFAPARGGYIWPGHSYLKFNIKQLFNKYNIKKLFNK